MARLELESCIPLAGQPRIPKILQGEQPQGLRVGVADVAGTLVFESLDWNWVFSMCTCSQRRDASTTLP